MIASCCTSRTQLGWAKRTAAANWRRACGEETAHSAKGYPTPTHRPTHQMDEVGGYFLTSRLFAQHGDLRKMSMGDQKLKMHNPSGRHLCTYVAFVPGNNTKIKQ